MSVWRMLVGGIRKRRQFEVRFLFRPRLLFPMVCKLLWPGAREGAKVKMDEPAQVG